MRLRGLFLVCAFIIPAAADEGLWLLNQFPKQAFREKYEFDVSDAFLQHLQLSSVRVGGESGAFVSPRGLIITNQRTVSGCLTAAKHLDDGFYAATPGQDVPCTGLEAQVLVAMENVTAEVKDAAADTAKAADALEKRNAAIARIEKACSEKTGNVCTVVRLFSGERYDLYHYRKYSDVRLVFAPERAIAQFGGNPAHLTFPRYALDVAFVRAYENGSPAATPEYLKWSADGVKDAATVLAVGSPAATARLSTVAQLNFYHDTSLSYALSRIQSRIRDLREFAGKSPVNQKAAEPTLAALGAEYKLTAGKLIGLADPLLMARKANFERRLRNAVQHDPKLGTEGGKVWDEIAAAYKAWAPSERMYQALSRPECDAADAGVKAVLEARFQEEIRALKDKSLKDKPRKPQKEAQQEEKLEDARARLVKRHRETIEALETSAAERIAQYRYRIFGDADYPDATGTPRITFGVVKAYRDRTEAPVPYATTFGGLFHLAGTIDPYKLPQRWADGKALLDLVTPMNFASTCDITSGASGPVVNRKGELVGFTFDGNLESIPLTYLYSDETARAVHVATQGIAEALRLLYKAPGLLEELGARPAPAVTAAR